MEFKFKRKYTLFFIISLILHVSILFFWICAPENLIKIKNGKSIITLLAFLNCELILLLCLGLAKKKYYAYFDKLVIKRSLRKNVEISYNDITKIKERKNDSILLGFGTRPSFTIYYKNTKKTIRTDNNDLFLKVIENEIKIANKNN